MASWWAKPQNDSIMDLDVLWNVEWGRLRPRSLPSYPQQGRPLPVMRGPVASVVGFDPSGHVSFVMSQLAASKENEEAPSDSAGLHAPRSGATSSPQQGSAKVGRYTEYGWGKRVVGVHSELMEESPILKNLVVVTIEQHVRIRAKCMYIIYIEILIRI
jgi:hypothetical protein